MGQVMLSFLEHFIQGGATLSKVVDPQSPSTVLYSPPKMCDSSAQRTCVIVPGSEKPELIAELCKDLDDEADEVTMWRQMSLRL